jgi:hypothetical protein
MVMKRTVFYMVGSFVFISFFFGCLTMDGYAAESSSKKAVSAVALRSARLHNYRRSFRRRCGKRCMARRYRQRQLRYRNRINIQKQILASQPVGKHFNSLAVSPEIVVTEKVGFSRTAEMVGDKVDLCYKFTDLDSQRFNSMAAQTVLGLPSTVNIMIMESDSTSLLCLSFPRGYSHALDRAEQDIKSYFTKNRLSLIEAGPSDSGMGDRVAELRR